MLPEKNTFYAAAIFHQQFTALQSLFFHTFPGLLKNRVSVFSNFRGNIRPAVASMMATSENMETALEDGLRLPKKGGGAARIPTFLAAILLVSIIIQFSENCTVFYKFFKIISFSFYISDFMLFFIFLTVWNKRFEEQHVTSCFGQLYKSLRVRRDACPEGGQNGKQPGRESSAFSRNAVSPAVGLYSNCSSPGLYSHHTACGKLLFPGTVFRHCPCSSEKSAPLSR